MSYHYIYKFKYLRSWNTNAEQARVDLEANIAEWINCGYEPVGGVSVTNVNGTVYMVQGMGLYAR